MSRNGFRITWHDMWPHILWVIPLVIGIWFDDWLDHLPSWQEIAVRCIGYFMIFTGLTILKRRESPNDEAAYVPVLRNAGWAVGLAMLPTILVDLLPWWAIFPLLLGAGVVCYILGGRSIARRMKQEAASRSQHGLE